jgi:adenylate cyclase
MRDAAEPGSERPPEAPSSVRFAGFILDLDASTLVRETGETVALTRGEFALLRTFVARPGRVLSREALLDALASRRFEPFDRSVDVMVGKLRRKIEPEVKQPRLITTVAGEGYRFDGMAKSPSSAKATAVPSSGNGQTSREDAAAEPKPISPAARPARPFLLWSALAAVLALAAASGWFFLSGKGSKTTDPARLSILVMPFDNLSGDPAQDYLVDALTDELTTSLARIHGSFVIARNTAMTFKGKPVDAKAIGKDLGVRYVLEGSVQPNGDRVRVNAQLIDAGSSAHLWAEQFDTPRADLLQTQDEIVTRLANTLKFQLTEAEGERLKRRPAANRDAEDLALQCGAEFWKSGFIGAAAEAAITLCDQALAIDANNVNALTILGWKLFMPAVLGASRDSKGDFERADAFVSKALALDADFVSALGQKGWILQNQGRTEESISEFERALSVDPSYVDADSGLGIDYEALGRFDKSIEVLDRAIKASPSDPSLTYYYNNKAVAYFGLKNYEQAIELTRRALSINQDNPYSHIYLVAALALTDRVAEARDALRSYLASSTVPFKTIAAWKAHQESMVAKGGGDPRYAEMNEWAYDGLRKAGMPEQ